MRPIGPALLALCLAGCPAVADEVTDAIDSALEAYGEGDFSYAAEELTFALQLLNEMKAGSLEAFLPEALDGWTRDIDPDGATGMGMMGGIAASASYSDGSDDFSITVMADSPMVTAMAPMFANAALLTAGGAKMVRVGREKFIDQNGELTGLVGNRILVQASGDAREAIVAHLETMDFRALANFGN